MKPGPQQQQDANKVQPLVFSKDPFEEAKRPRRIQQIQFGLQSPQEIVKCGAFHVYERSLYKMPERVPYPNGVLDRRLGVSSKTAVCETCHQKLAECEGHFGYIHLELPVFHIGYFKNTLQVLQCICKSCSRVLLPDNERLLWLKKFRNPRVERTQREAMFKKVNERCKRQRQCPYCGNFNGTVKKTTGALKIVHERYDRKKKPNLHDWFKDQFQEAAKYNEGLRSNLHKIADDLHPLRVQALFEAIPDDDCGVLDLHGTRPEMLVVRAVAVPPVAIRPSVEMDGASNEDDITMKLMQIIEVNAVLRQGLDKGLPITNLMENWDFLQVQCAMLINSDLPGLPLQFQTPGRPTRGFVQRLKGKQGRFRGNLSGKRVDFSGRTVISPDPNLAINQVCVPQHMAVVLTYPERVTSHNLDKLKQRVLNGTTQWPGASFVVQPNGDKTFLKYGDRRRIANDLKVGCIVERHLEDGDVVLFNRQPSLHRISIMAFRAKVRPWRTLRFNECCCSPFNADFDGDEMNLHLPQTEEARAEALLLMGSTANLATPKNGDIMIAATQDFLTCAFLVTCKDTFFTRSEMCLLASYMADARDHVDLPPPAILKPMELWTGKQLFSLIVRPNAQTRVFVNLEIAEKIYTKGRETMCPNDGYVMFRNSDLICGRIGKVVLGGSKGGLFGTLNTDYSSLVAAACMSRLAKMAARHMGNRGFSIGIDDVTPSSALCDTKAGIISKGYRQCDNFIDLYKKGALELQTGCNLDQTLESKMTRELNDLREQAGKACMDTLRSFNSPLIMSQCGSKGSPINIAQMVVCVGQQSVGGKRAFNGFTNRTLPHFKRGDRNGPAKGFVSNSFYSGLTATEFWFHTMGGREGLVDTAVKTAETGYMSRRLMKALEDLYTHYDNTVRNAAGGIVQFTYGDDGLDPVVMEGKEGLPLDFDRLLAKVKATTRRLRVTEGGRTEVPLPADLAAAVDVQLSRPQLTPAVVIKDEGGADGLEEAGPKRPSWHKKCDPRPAELASEKRCSELFRDEIKHFLHDQVAAYKSARKVLGLEDDRRSSEELEYVAGLKGLTLAQLKAFVDRAIDKYERKRMDPGSTVGAIGAQSIGEPGTQMTLKTFHFAGVASMNVTLGVPRIKEIINAAKNISTPIMKVFLDMPRGQKKENQKLSAQFVKARLERTLLGQVASSIKLVFRPRGEGVADQGDAYISIMLNRDTIRALHLAIDSHTVRESILTHPRIKLKMQHVQLADDWEVQVMPPDDSRQGMMFSLELLLGILPKVIVQGIPTVERVVIKEVSGKEEKELANGCDYMMLVEGTDLRRVMATLGVHGCTTHTNHVHEIEKCLGIEAARKAIIQEIEYTMGSHGMTIDKRHTMLLADCMTYKGEVLGITRFGIAKMKDSVLHSASFEKTADHLFDAAIHGRVDDVVGVSESIIMGIPMATGTGIFKLRHHVGELGAGDPMLLDIGTNLDSSGAAGRSARDVDAPIDLPQRPLPVLAF